MALALFAVIELLKFLFTTAIAFVPPAFAIIVPVITEAVPQERFGKAFARVATDPLATTDATSISLGNAFFFAVVKLQRQVA